MKKNIALLIAQIIVFCISLCYFDYSFQWIIDYKIENVLIFVMSILFSLMVAKAIIILSKKDEKSFVDGVTFGMISIVFFLVASRNYDGSVSENILNNVSFPVVGITSSVCSIYSIIIRRHKK